MVFNRVQIFMIKFELKNLNNKESSIKFEKSFLDLNITTKGDDFTYKLFEKETNFYFSMLTHPTYPVIFHYQCPMAQFFSEFLKIARCTHRLPNFLPLVP